MAKLKKVLFILLIILLSNNCAGDRDPNSGPGPSLSPVGEYQVTLLILDWTDNSGSRNVEIVTTDCDRESIFKFNSNGTLEFSNHNIDNDDDCSNIELISGIYGESNYSNPGGFNGTFVFNDLFNGEEITSGQFRDLGTEGQAMSLTFYTLINGISYKYEYSTLKI